MANDDGSRGAGGSLGKPERFLAFLPIVFLFAHLQARSGAGLNSTMTGPDGYGIWEMQ